VLGIALGLASSISWGLSDFLGGSQSRRLPALSVLIVSQPVGFVLAMAIALSSGPDPLGAGDTAAAVGGGAAGVMALGCFYVAMARGAISVVAPVASLGVIVPIVVGLGRGEDPTGLQMAGLALALVGISLAVRETDHADSPSVPTVSIVLAGLAGLGFGAFFVGMDSAADTDALWATAYARVGGISVVAGAALAASVVARGNLRFSRAALPVLLAIGLLDILANTLFAFASREGLLALVAVAGSLYPVVTVLLARFVLGERLAPLQQGGVVLALAGTALLAAGS
jgi:drug/metabolite transporter (DMT)-like permease